MGDRLISLCARAVPEVTPLDLVGVAEDTGFGAVGFAFDTMDALDVPLARKLRARLADSPLDCLDLDVVRIAPGALDARAYRFLDHAHDLGARHVLTVSEDPDRAATIEKFAALCDHAATAGLGLVFEFLSLTPYATLDDAFEIVSAAARPNGRILVDTLHLARAGHDPAYPENFDPALFPYIQICDGPRTIDMNDIEARRFDAREGRLPPGEGDLPLKAMLAAFGPHVPVSVEVRSQRYNRRFEDARERARHFLLCTKALETDQSDSSYPA